MLDDYRFWYLDLSGTSHDYIMEAEDARKLLMDRLMDLEIDDAERSIAVDEIDSFIEDHIEGSEWLQENSFKLVCVARRTVRRMKGGR